jgi:hypothetical protein
MASPRNVPHTGRTYYPPPTAVYRDRLGLDHGRLSELEALALRNRRLQALVARLLAERLEPCQSCGASRLGTVR